MEDETELIIKHDDKHVDSEAKTTEVDISVGKDESVVVSEVKETTQADNENQEIPQMEVPQKEIPQKEILQEETPQKEASPESELQDNTTDQSSEPTNPSRIDDIQNKMENYPLPTPEISEMSPPPLPE